MFRFFRFFGFISFSKETAFKEKLKSDLAFKSKFAPLFSDELNIRMLNKGRIIGVLGQNYGEVHAKREFRRGKGIKTHPFIINRDWVYFGFSKKSISKNILSRLEKAYKKVKAKGTFQKIINSYN